MSEHKSPDKIRAVVRLVADTLNLPEDDLGPDTSMDNTPAWDSVEHMNICLSFEREFAIKLNMDIIASGTSIRALADFVP